MQDAMGEIVEKRAEGAVNVGVLAAFTAEWAAQPRTAVQAIGFVRMSAAFARFGFDRAAEDAASDRIRNCFEFAHRPPFETILCAVRGSC